MRITSLALAIALLLAACADSTGDAPRRENSCGRFAYVASGTGTCDDCSLTCDCPEGWPTSIADCTPDGCIVGGNCEEVCKAELTEAVKCTDTYTLK